MLKTLLQMLHAVLPSSVSLKAAGVELEPEMDSIPVRWIGLESIDRVR